MKKGKKPIKEVKDERYELLHRAYDWREDNLSVTITCTKIEINDNNGQKTTSKKGKTS